MSKHILLINPNTSHATTAMMVRIAADGLPPGWHVEGRTVERGVPMIVNQAELDAAGDEVMRCWQRSRVAPWAGVIVGAYGDPGLASLRLTSRVPVVGICEASMLEAAAGGRRFGVATVTPELVDAIDAKACALGLAPHYTGTRLTAGEPRALTADRYALEAALAQAVRRCIEIDGAEAVIIGGGPLAQAADGLTARFEVPVIEPIPAAVRRLVAQIGCGVGAREALPMG